VRAGGGRWVGGGVWGFWAGVAAAFSDEFGDGIDGSDVEVSLGECDFDAFFSEAFGDGAVEVVPDGDEFVDVRDEAAELEVECGVAEGAEENEGLWILEDIGLLCGDVEEDALGSVDVGRVGDADGDGEAEDRVGEGPVDDIAGDEVFVWDDEFFSVPVGDGGRAHADAGDGSAGGSDGDGVADTDGSFGEDDES